MAKRKGADPTRAGRNQTAREARVLRELERQKRRRAKQHTDISVGVQR